MATRRNQALASLWCRAGRWRTSGTSGKTTWPRRLSSRPSATCSPSSSKKLKKAPAPPVQLQPQPQYQPIDPAQDPAGYHARIQGVLLNERLNMSKMMLRKELGAEKVDAAIAEFKQHAAADPRLYTQLYRQTDPYGWMAGKVERLGLIRRVTTDPAGYEAELRAKWEAEANGTPPAPRVSPAAKLPPSLANVRSALPRSSSAYTGPQSLDNILGQRATTRH